MYRALKHARSNVYFRQLHSHTMLQIEKGGFFGKLFGRGQKPEETNKPTETDTSSESPVPQSPLGSDNITFTTGDNGIAIETADDYEYSSEEIDLINNNAVKNKLKYFSSEEVEEKLRPIVQEVFPDVQETWKDCNIATTLIKEKVALQSFKAFNKEIDSLSLNNMQTVHDLIKFYTQKPNPVLVKHAVAQYFTSLDSDKIPPNMRFVPFHKHQRKLHAFN